LSKKKFLFSPEIILMSTPVLQTHKTTGDTLSGEREREREKDTQMRDCSKN
jgi:hypothetical protein